MQVELNSILVDISKPLEIQVKIRRTNKIIKGIKRNKKKNISYLSNIS